MPRSWIWLVFAAGCRIGTMSPEEFDRDYPVGRLTTLSPTGMKESLAALRQAVGGDKVRITSLTFGDGRTTFVAQNPRSPSDFDSYYYWQGDVHVSPVTMHGDEDKRYIARLFDLDSVPFDKLPGIARKAMTALPIDGAHVGTVGVDLDDGVLEVSVRLESKRRSGHVEFDAAGNVLSAKPD